MNKTVLILNESQTTANMLENFLLSEYERVNVIKTTADEAFNKLDNGSYTPDLIIYAKSPTEDSLTLPENISTPLLLLTENQENKNIAALVEKFKFLGYLPKPFEAVQIDDKIKSILTKSNIEEAEVLPNFNAIDDEIIDLFAKQSEDKKDILMDEIENKINPAKHYQEIKSDSVSSKKDQPIPQKSVVDLIWEDRNQKNQPVNAAKVPTDKVSQDECSMLYLPENSEESARLNESNLDIFDQISANILPVDENKIENQLEDNEKENDNNSQFISEEDDSKAADSLLNMNDKEETLDLKEQNPDFQLPEDDTIEISKNTLQSYNIEENYFSDRKREYIATKEDDALSESFNFLNNKVKAPLEDDIDTIDANENETMDAAFDFQKPLSTSNNENKEDITDKEDVGNSVYDNLKKSFDHKSVEIKKQLDSIAGENESTDENDIDYFTKNLDESSDEDELSKSLAEDFKRLKESPDTDYTSVGFDPENIKFNTSPISLMDDDENKNYASDNLNDTQNKDTEKNIDNDIQDVHNDKFNLEEEDDNLITQNIDNKDTAVHYPQKTLRKRDIISMIKSSFTESGNKKNNISSLSSKIKALEEHIRISESQNQTAKSLLESIKKSIKD